MPKVKLGPKPFLLPQPALLVGTLVGGIPNYMVAAWCGMANHVPPMVSVAVRPNRHTEKGIRAHGAFSLNVPSAALVRDTDYCGIVSGAKEDKSAVFTSVTGTVEGVPLIAECPLSLECRLVQTLELPTHRLHLGEIVEVHAEEGCLVEGLPDMGRVDPLIYSITDGQYWQIGRPVGRAFHVGRREPGPAGR
ncbi:MAG: flavin reductase family protein [Deferrisomatales bacterium]|nr:flavin reductase family protein [Deferrisomatales bacterium]